MIKDEKKGLSNTTEEEETRKFHREMLSPEAIKPDKIRNTKTINVKNKIPSIDIKEQLNYKQSWNDRQMIRQQTNQTTD